MRPNPGRVFGGSGPGVRTFAHLGGAFTEICPDPVYRQPDGERTGFPLRLQLLPPEAVGELTSWACASGLARLHALEHNVQWTRVNTDLDVIVNARSRTAMVRSRTRDLSNSRRLQFRFALTKGISRRHHLTRELPQVARRGAERPG